MRLDELFEARVVESRLLLELNWFDKNPLYKVLQKNRGRFIHFTRGAPNRVPKSYGGGRSDEPKYEDLPERPVNDGGYGFQKKLDAWQAEIKRIKKRNANDMVPKIGVNPNPFHRDALGVYFYRIEWLLAGHERVLQGAQYGLNGNNFPYYYICDINLSDPNGIILQKITWDQIGHLAAKNGWKAELDAFRQQSFEEQKAILPKYCDPNLPGSFLWHFVESLVKANKIHWNRALRGVSFIQDAGGSIIHNNEPDQLVVFNPKVMKIVDQGSTAPVDHQMDQSQGAWQYALVNIMKAVRGEVGGDLTWNKKKPTLTYKIGWATFTIELPSRDTDVGLRVTETYGRAKDEYSIGRERLDKESQEQIVASIVTKSKRTAAQKSDLLFTPVLSIKDFRTFVDGKIGSGATFVFSEEIANPQNQGLKNCRLAINGKSEAKAGENEIRNRVFGYITPEDFTVSAYVNINNQDVVYCQTPFGDHFTAEQLDDVLDGLAKDFFERAEGHFKRVSPEFKYGKSWEKFSTPEELTAYKGWFALHCGINLGGRIAAQYHSEIAAYQALPEKTRQGLDKTEMDYKIHSVTRKRDY